MLYTDAIKDKWRCTH